MKLNVPPILLTSCVVISDQSVNLKDKNSRILLTLDSIQKWLDLSPGLRLIVCDGSNYDFSEHVREKFPHSQIECLCFENNKELVALHGKGYGEGEIVNHAIQNSAFIKEAGFFAKCTAKLWVENFFECLQGWNGSFLCKGYFSDVFSPIKKTRFSYIDTRFYVVDTAFYLKYLDSAHLNVGGKSKLSLEDCFKDIIIKQNLDKVLFTVPPVICGVGGGTGTYYKNNLKRRIKEAIRIWLLKHNKSFKFLFSDSVS